MKTTHIRELYTTAEIRDKIASDQYCPELLLQHAMLHLDRLEAAPHTATPVVAWRVRGYAQFKTGKPGPWRYFDGPTTPAVNTPDCCDIEPLYAAPASDAESMQGSQPTKDAA